MDIVPLVLLATIVAKVVDIIRYATSRDWNGVLTIGTSWLAGVVGAASVAATRFGEQIELSIGNGETMTLASLGFVEQVVLGMALASLLGVVVDFRRHSPPPLLEGKTDPE